MKILKILLILVFLLSLEVQPLQANQTYQKAATFFTKSYQRRVIYNSPGGKVTVHFLVQKDTKGQVKAVKATFVSGDRDSSFYVQSFGKAIGKVVIGKNIKNLSLKAVGGASLTTRAFTSYINTIK